MVGMTDQDPPADPVATPVPGERRLARPPSDRYREAETRAAAAAAPRQVSPVRGVTLGALVGLGGAAVIVLVGGVLAMTIGLIVVAGILGWLVAVAVGHGAGATLPTARRAWAAAAIALIAVLLGQVGLWLYAASEGGVLSLPDYLGEVYGPLVPVQAIIAPVIAWVTAR
jgi:hypothetical protein